MIFNQQTYPQIKSACEAKQPVEFDVERSATAFAAGQAPAQWTAYPPALLPPEGYANVFLHAGNDARGTLTRLELVVHLDGGRILYQANGVELVTLRVTWPATSKP